MVAKFLVCALLAIQVHVLFDSLEKDQKGIGPQDDGCQLCATALSTVACSPVVGPIIRPALLPLALELALSPELVTPFKIELPELRGPPASLLA